MFEVLLVACLFVVMPALAGLAVIRVFRNRGVVARQLDELRRSIRKTADDRRAGKVRDVTPW